jgi:hypothetical protein
MTISKIILIVAIVLDAGYDIWSYIRYGESPASLTKSLIEGALVFYIGLDFSLQHFYGPSATITDNLRVLDAKSGRLIFLGYIALGFHLWAPYPLGSYVRSVVLQMAGMNTQ